MLKKADAQMSFTDADVLCAHMLDPDSFYAKMSRHGHNWFRDEDFAAMYSSWRGRASVPPSLMVGALILQNYDSISDRELADRIAFDLRYKVALRVPVDFPGVDPSLFSIFRARLISNQLEGVAFERSVERARKSGVLNPKEQQAVDSMPILGAAAVQDTYTLVRTGIEKLLRAIDSQRDEWEGSRGFRYPFRKEKYLGQKRGKPDIDWNDEAQKARYLQELVADARSLLRAVGASGMKDSQRVGDQCDLLRDILVQDVQLIENQSAAWYEVIAAAGLLQGLALPLALLGSFVPRIRKATNNRILSTNDPEMRHGHKSKSKLFDGYKGHFTVGVETEIVTGVEITPANVADNKPTVSMVDSLQMRGLFPGRIYGDGAYGGADTRAALEARGVEMFSRVPRTATGGRFPKSLFRISLPEMSVTCPAGHTSFQHRPSKDAEGRLAPTFKFPRELCGACPLRNECIPPTARYREIQLHHHEEQLQKAREQNAAPDFRQEYKKRLVVERVQARLKDYSLRAGRYFGTQKVRLQAYFAAAANNFWRVTTILEAQPA